MPSHIARVASVAREFRFQGQRAVHDDEALTTPERNAVINRDEGDFTEADKLCPPRDIVDNRAGLSRPRRFGTDREVVEEQRFALVGNGSQRRVEGRYRSTRPGIGDQIPFERPRPIVQREAPGRTEREPLGEARRVLMVLRKRDPGDVGNLREVCRRQGSPSKLGQGPISRYRLVDAWYRIRRCRVVVA